MTLEFSRESIRPPTIGHIWVPRSSARAAASGMSMHSPCARPVVFAQRALYGAIRVFGPRILPGPRETWDDPLESDVWGMFVDQWRSEFGTWDSAALYRRPQSGRTGCAVLLFRDGRGVGFVRVTTSEARVEREFRVLDGVHAARPTTFAVARPRAWGAERGWAWLGTESVPNYPLGAVRRASVRLPVIDELGSILDGVLPRAESVPAHWRGSHGDLAPWNLRTELGGAVRVIDWEDADYAPPGTDIVYSGVTAHTTFGTALPTDVNAEAVGFVADLIAARRAIDEDAGSLNNRLLDAMAKLTVAPRRSAPESGVIASE